jgi:ubiquitin-protein ligase
MMQEARWTAEVAIMHQRFPTFVAFKTENSSVGFCGQVRGRRSGREYTITVKVPAQSYPESEPAVYIQPRIASGYWQPNGSLSICHARPWAPSRNTFANCVICAIRFLEEFDR